jgi:hypothetical protein
MRRANVYTLILITVLNLFIAACGRNSAQANAGYYQVTLYGYTCITNNVSIWCDPN